ncbi:hypothetical protein HN51_031953 [Arachis hypogaea]
MAIVATNILSLYHLSSTLQSPKSPPLPPPLATSPETCRTNPHPLSLKPFPFFTLRFLCFNPSFDSSKFTTYKTDLDLPISQLFQIAKSTKSVIRLGFDVGGGTGSFAATTKLRNVTVVTTTMRMGVPYSEAVALRGLVPLHVPLQQRLPVFDGVVDLVRCGCAVNRWIPVTMMEFLLFDVDRVLRGGGVKKMQAEAQISVIPDTNLNLENVVSIQNRDPVVSSSLSNATTTQQPGCLFTFVPNLFHYDL